MPEGIELNPLTAFYRAKHQDAVDELALAQAALSGAQQTIAGQRELITQLQEQLEEARKPRRKPRKPANPEPEPDPE